MYIYIIYHISLAQAIVYILTHALTHGWTHTHTPNSYAHETLHMARERSMYAAHTSVINAVYTPSVQSTGPVHWSSDCRLPVIRTVQKSITVKVWILFLSIRHLFSMTYVCTYVKDKSPGFFSYLTLKLLPCFQPTFQLVYG